MATKDEVHHVHQSPGLSEGEVKATHKRREKVLMCLETLGIYCEQNNVPNIVVLGSGGGLRAMIALLGTLMELKKQNFLDAVMYLCGVSGSTWCMSLLYENGKWSEKLMSLEEELCESLSNSSWHLGKAEEYLEELSKDENYSLTDFWAACFVYQILQQFDENELADHSEAVETGVNPYPIYAAVDKEKLSEKGGNFPGTWFEFTPHSAGYTALGAFVSTRYFGSEFEKGNLKKKKKKVLCYMQGLWGSAIGSMEENIKFIRDILGRLVQLRLRTLFVVLERDTVIACQANLLLLDLQLCAISGSDPKEVFEKLRSVLSDDKEKTASIKLCTAIHNTWAMKTREERMASCAELGEQIEKEFGGHLGQGIPQGKLPPSQAVLLGSVWGLLRVVSKTVQCVLTWKWGTTHNFLYKSPNIKPSYLVENKIISLIDAGLAINSAYPLVLQAQRQTDLIISFDFSSGDPFETIKKAASYCQENHIPFPNIKDQKMDENNPSDCYIFRGDKSCPTVMHFPLFNNVNCSGEIEDYRKRFSTFRMSFPGEAIKDLLKKAGLNVSNNRAKIRNEINRLVLSSRTKELQKRVFVSFYTR
ncbi:cytosolic phospholipase A2 gamma isoform X3 [Strigops habroptila]|uniref:Phospholipase A2 group IVC n=1 Tax=Strigops habroptila TaxID=2489341 RepID=A0A672V1V9_STRHB|nr:cytosolic phospholipase A2 gamma isoform X3 [Strigops habroptila]XP_030364283.1 cytosolic phospholipase A2 gamma isoform X3 [Strigops habroptila]XP_030364284.1 cytosolic phospholipase A2 gamma isoform X3 [Strigops habroptila]